MSDDRIHVLATGGTIASCLVDGTWTETPGGALLDDVVRSGLLGAGQRERIDVDDVAAGPSSNLTVADMVAIARRIEACLAGDASGAPAAGVVVLHGTDTIELTAFVTDLLLGVRPGRRPVVFTGAMRVRSHPDPDGPGNVADAVRTAWSPSAAGRDVLVCLDGRIHSSAAVTKVHARSVDAFESAPLAPSGRVRDGRVEFVGDAPAERPPARGLDVDVPLLTCYPGIEPGAFDTVADGHRGVVLEVFGDLHVPRQLWGPIRAAADAGVLVVLASRPFTDTARTDDLDFLGAVGAGGLNAQKARLATMAALTTCSDRDDAAAFVHRHRLVHDPLDRRST
ncbi:MAG: hypothetical protein RI958_2479 [Actinomycetota bacterium]